MNIAAIRKYTFALSATLVVLSVIALGVFGLKPGIDFTGGSLLEVRFSGEVPGATEITQVIQEAETSVDVGDVVVQQAGDSGIILRLQFLGEDDHQRIVGELRERFETDENTMREERFETIGSSVSATLREQSIWIGIGVVIAIVLYVAYAFRKVAKPVASWKYGVTAVIALFHDVLITAGIFAVLGNVLGLEVGIPFVVALLTIMGYSVNDTIVVFDRVREHLLSLGSGKFTEAVRLGVSQSVTRSINTSLTTLLVLFALFFYGGESIRWFALALIIGLVSGTYSSLFLASPLLLEWEKRGKKENI